MRTSHRQSGGWFRFPARVLLASIAILLCGVGAGLAEPTWEQIGPTWPGPAYPATVAVDPTDPDHLMVGTMGEGLFYTFDGGGRWDQNYWDFFIQEGIASTLIRRVVLSKGIADAVQGVIGTVSGTYYSPDGGVRWFRHPANEVGGSPAITQDALELPDHTAVIFSELFSGGGGGLLWFYQWPATAGEPGTWSVLDPTLAGRRASLGALVFGRTTPLRLYAGFSVAGAAVVYYDEPKVGGAPTRIRCSSGLPTTGVIPIAMTAHPGQADDVLVAAGPTLYRNDGDCTWKATGAGLPAGFRVMDLIHDVWDPDLVYAGTNGDGVYISRDDGRSFEPVSKNGMGHLSVTDLEIDPSRPDYLLATSRDGENNGSLYRIFLPDVRPGGKAAEAPAPRVSLTLSAPNPFAAGSALRFSLPRATQVQLAVYDLAGRRVAMLRDGVMPAGEHAVEWGGLDDNGHRVAAGVYFCRLVAGEARTVQRLVIAR